MTNDPEKIHATNIDTLPLVETDAQALEMYRKQIAADLEQAFTEPSSDMAAVELVDGQQGIVSPEQNIVNEVKQVVGSETVATEPLDEAGQKLVVDYLWLANHISRRYKNLGFPPEDIEQAANLALIGAAQRFDAERGIKFTTFAGRTIEGSLKRYFRDNTWSVRVPRTLKDSRLAINGAVEPLTQQLGRRPTHDEISERTGLDASAIEEAQTFMFALGGNQSLDDTLSDGTTRGDMVMSAESGIDLDESIVIRQALSKLKEKTRKAVQLSFWQGMTQAQIAEELGISQVHASRLLRQGIDQLKDLLSEQAEE